VVRELMASVKASIERGDDPVVGRTEKQVTGFKGRSGRSFRAKLKMAKNEEDKWRVEFDEEWATNAYSRPEEGQEGVDNGAGAAEKKKPAAKKKAAGKKPAGANGAAKNGEAAGESAPEPEPAHPA